MANPNPKNLLDDTGMEMVNVLRRIGAKLAGTSPEEVAINYLDNNFNMLDSTGKKLVEALNTIDEAVGQGAGGGTISPATDQSAGLMSAEDKAKLDAFSSADTYLTFSDVSMISSLMPIVADAEHLPETAEPGQPVFVEDTGDLYIRTETDWIKLKTGGGDDEGIPISVIDQIIEEETHGGGD